MSATGFKSTRLQDDYAFLGDCPEAVFNEVVTLPVGTLRERVAGAAAWQTALLAGRLPDPGWPGEPYEAPIRAALESLNVARFCREQPELTEALLRDILDAVSRGQAALSAAVLDRIAELEAQELERLKRKQAGRKKRLSVRIDPGVRGQLRERARRLALSDHPPIDEDLIAAWAERAQVWGELAEVFEDLGGMLGQGWDFAQGVLKHVGWLEIARLRALLAQIPQLQAIIKSLGRLQSSDSGESTSEKVLLPIQRLAEELREVRAPHVPAETRGVERSAALERMLPGEAALLGHPKLRLLWHARRAERALLTYRVEGVMTERVLNEVQDHQEVERRRPRPQRGPVIVAVDTSGSMRGAPESVAKALVLEALRTAHAEKRRCYLYAFSGPTDLVEHELDLGPEGLGELLQFLALSFSGGTDPSQALDRLLNRLQQDDWSRADVLFVSDGEFPVSSPMIARVEAARERETRFHGVLIGSQRKTGLHEICDPVHVFSDWSALS